MYSTEYSVQCPALDLHGVLTRLTEQDLDADHEEIRKSKCFVHLHNQHPEEEPDRWPLIMAVLSWARPYQ